ncbi:uncharacterized protein LOC135133416 [Zophobas morio]|uniref:uncharacterized protein LOC135133416 n=1 Tax=Zophobas morio TaxID=2755281 RepID=UPI0030838979
MINLNRLVFLYCCLMAIAAGTRLYKYFPDLFDDEDVGALIVARNSLTNRSQNVRKFCGDLICIEKEHDVVANEKELIPNARNITCETCYNMTANALATPITQERHVTVYEKESNTCYRLITQSRRINDGCKCSTK